MDTILLLVILVLAATGGPRDTGMPVAPPEIDETISYEQKKPEEQWKDMRQHPELTESSGMQKPSSPLPWAGLFKKSRPKEKGAVGTTGDDKKKGVQAGSDNAVKPDETVQTSKNTTSALKTDSADETKKTRQLNEPEPVQQKRLQERVDRRK